MTTSLVFWCESTEPSRPSRQDLPDGVHWMRLPEIPLPVFEGPEFEDLLMPSVRGARRYRVDLVRYTCTCPEFPDRLKFSPNNRHRACPHIKDAIERYHPGFFRSAFIREVSDLAEQRGGSERMVFDDAEFIIARTAERGWYDVWLIGKYRWDQFGYLPRERRWSRNLLPPHADALARAIEARSH